MAPRIRVAIVAGIAAVAAGVWWFYRPDPVASSGSPAERDAALRRSPFASTSLATSPSAGTQQSSAPDPNANSVARMRELSADFSRREELYAKAARADRGQLDDLIAAAKRSPGRESRRGDLEVLLLRYAEIDPQAALRIAADMDRDTAGHLVRMLAASDPQQAWQQVAEIEDPLSRQYLLSAVVTAWVAQEPRRAFAQVAGLPPGWERDEMLKGTAADVARRDPALAVELIQGLEADKAASLNQLVAAEWARFDPTAAARWIESIEPAKQGALAYTIASAYVMQKPTEALAWALRISRSPSRNLWSSMLGEMAVANPDEALRLALGGESSIQRANAAGAVLGTIALKDQALAMSYLQKLPASVRNQVFQSVARAVTAASPAEGLEWLDRTEDRRMRADAFMRLSTDLAFSDVESAASLVDRVPREVRGAWISNVARAYISLDIDKAQAWVEKYKDEVKHLDTNFAQLLGTRNPTAALEMVERAADTKERDRLLAGVLPAIARDDAEKAAQWTDRIGDERQRAQVVSSVASTWASYDPPAARKWLMSMRDGEAKDRGLWALSGQSETVDDIAEAVREIRSPDVRMQAVLTAAMRLKARDPDSARALLRRYPLDPQRQSQYESYDGNNGRYYWGGYDQ